jgi:DnaJ domain
VRIPLDYYRILGLPLAASEEQLRQAYSDRIVQLPRREYSQAAISSRKQLIEEAYVVLSDPKQRSTYDQLYLAHAYDPDKLAAAPVALENRPESTKKGIDTQSLGIEITQDELVGALLILQELGEYELVLKLGRPYLVNKNGATSARKSNNLADEEIHESAEHPDVVLTVALACLELGREQWQQGHYENAAISLETGQELLVREGLFASVQAEIQADLYKLRPYRILELLALPQEKTAERSQGLELLQNLLEDRGGIDGTNNDDSGLNIDDFLRFIQQLRNHLTVAEQHKLFEAQSKRNSAVATYLAVYALIARGFAQRQPALIRQARQMLMRLGKRQDVHLEQSLCALLLGQTEEATRVLELSQEYEALAFIREKSQDSPDLLPGLCLYAEQWLQHEVFPHFRDLANQQAFLKDYFANQQVQAYLEALPTDAETTNEWAVINPQ